MTLPRPTLALLAAAALVALATLLAGADAGHARPRAGSERTPTALEVELASGIADLARARIGIADATINVTRVELPDGVYAHAKVASLELASKGRPIGSVTARARVVTGTNERELWVKAQVEVVVPTVVAARPITRGAVLVEADARVEARPLRDDRMAFIALLVGSQARLAIAVGEPIGPRDLEQPLLVRRGDAVTVSVSGASFQLEAAGEALEAGALGAEIALRMRHGQKKVVRGVVTGPRRLELR